MRGAVGHFADGVLQLRNYVHSGNVRITAEDAAGTVRTLFEGDPDGSAQVYYDGSIILQTNAGIMQLRSVGSTDAEARYILGEHADGTDRWRIGNVSAATLNIQNLIQGGQVRIEGEPTGGGTSRMILANPDSDMSFYYPGTDDIRLQMRPSGVMRVLSDGNLDTEGRAVHLTHGDATLRGEFGYTTSSDLNIIQRIHGALIRVYAEDAAGVLREMIRADGDARAQLGYAGTFVFRTNNEDLAGESSGAEVVDHEGNWHDVGFNVLPLFNDDVNDTLEAMHTGAINIIELAADKTVTLEANTAGDFQVGSVAHFANLSTANDYIVAEGTGTTLFYIEPGSGAVDTTGGATIGPGGVATIYRRSATDYWIWGSEITYTP